MSALRRNRSFNTRPPDSAEGISSVLEAVLRRCPVHGEGTLERSGSERRRKTLNSPPTAPFTPRVQRLSSGLSDLTIERNYQVEADNYGPKYSDKQVAYETREEKLGNGEEESVEFRVGMSVFAWGFGKMGQLGDGKSESAPLPMELKIPNPLDRPARISTGALFTLILTQRGDVYVCGCGKYGRLGTGSEADVPVLTKIIPAKDAKVSQIGAGSWHGCGVTFLGRLYTWGYNSKHNVLGRDCDQRCSLLPGLVPSIASLKVRQVSCGHNFSLLATSDGDVYSWGCGRYGVLAHGHEKCVLKPKKVSSFRVAIRSVDAGYAHCGAVSEDGRVYMWGKGADGALGLGEGRLHNVPLPTWLNHLDFITANIIMISCSVGEHRGHSLALSENGAVFAWGSNYMGKLGLGDREDRYVPVKIPAVFFARIPLENGFTTNETRSRKFDTSSNNSKLNGGFQRSQSMRRPTTARKNPSFPLSVEPPGESHCKVRKISAGGVHSGAVTMDGRIFTWGCGKDGRLGHMGVEAMPKTYHSNVPKQVVALEAVGKSTGRIGVDISCSHYHTVVLLDFPK